MARKGSKRRMLKVDQVSQSDEENETPGSGKMKDNGMANVDYDDAEQVNQEADADEHDGGNFADDDDDEENDKVDEDDSNDDESPENEDEGRVKENQMEDDDDDEQEGNDIQLTTGMANAMARILGGESFASKTSSVAEQIKRDRPVVLSKTKTPLQVQAAKEEKARRELLETRRLHKEKRELAALHIPLSVATARTFVLPGDTSKGMTVSVELEQERMHRRVATRGIVVLFNAIATHQVNPTQTAEAAAEATSTKSTKAKATKLTKHGFLDLIKQTAAAKANAATSVAADTGMTTTGANAKDEHQQWNALKDDFMLDSKKNWDEEDDDEESIEGNEQAERSSPKKRHKAR